MTAYESIIEGKFDIEKSVYLHKLINSEETEANLKLSCPVCQSRKLDYYKNYVFCHKCKTENSAVEFVKHNLQMKQEEAEIFILENLNP